MWDKALAYCRQAGDKALARSAYREAVVCFEQALVALEHLPDSRATPSRPSTSGSACAPRSLPWENQERMLDHLRRAETLAEALGDQRGSGGSTST